MFSAFVFCLCIGAAFPQDSQSWGIQSENSQNVVIKPKSVVLDSNYDTTSVPDMLSMFAGWNDSLTPAFVNEHDVWEPAIKEMEPGSGVYAIEGYAMGYLGVVKTTDENNQDWLVMIDSTEGQFSTRKVMQDIRANIDALKNAPIRAVIYSLYHGDHIFGGHTYFEDELTQAFYAGQSQYGNIDFYAHSTMMPNAEDFSTWHGFKVPRAIRMFGSMLPDFMDLYKYSGIPIERLEHVSALLYTKAPTTIPIGLTDAQPTQTINIGGRDFKFVWLPGYTTDQMATYIADCNTIFAADTMYMAFPNLYTIRGEPARYAVGWADAIDTVLSYTPDHIAFNHNPHISGWETIRDTMTTYRDAIHYLNDQTVGRLILDKSCDEIVDEITLPAAYQTEYLTVVYGRIEWHIKSICDYYVGWFDGDGENLLALSRDAKSKKWQNLLGDSDGAILLTLAEVAYSMAESTKDESDYQFALEMASMIYRNKGIDKNSDIYKRSIELRRYSMLGITQPALSQNVRNYMNTLILEDAGFLHNAANFAGPGAYGKGGLYFWLSFGSIFKNMAAMLGDGANGVSHSLTLNLAGVDNDGSSVGLTYKLSIRNSILVVNEDDVSAADDTLTCGPATFRDILSGLTDTSACISASAGVDSFLGYFNFIRDHGGSGIAFNYAGLFWVKYYEQKYDVDLYGFCKLYFGPNYMTWGMFCPCVLLPWGTDTSLWAGPCEQAKLMLNSVEVFN
jgi:alkyl sulfatase BDS1-like metallo-beta-lactamase superfamily hydrolase